MIKPLTIILILSTVLGSFSNYLIQNNAGRNAAHFTRSKQGSSNQANLNSSFHSNTSATILFVGNSLTITNNLPKLVQQNADLRSINLDIKMIVHPSYTIIDHWKKGDVIEAINKMKFDYIIIQQGPSSQPYGREILIDVGEKFDSLCKTNGSKLCYFMVWPSLNNYHSFDMVIKNYHDAAALNGAILLPVGKAWKKHFDSTKNFDYYGMDGFHPSYKGSLAAAQVIVETLFPE